MRKTLIVMGAAALLATSGCSQMNQREVTVKVEDKERVCSGSTDGSSSCSYLIFTDQGTFENSDALLEGKFNSSDIYGQIKEGQTYTFLVAGYRQGFLSMYPNILEVRSSG